MPQALQLQSWWSLEDVLRRQVLALHIDPEQVEYAGTIQRAVTTLGHEENQNVAGLALLRPNEAVGFLVLKRGDSAPTWATAGMAVVSAMRVDLRHQGGGVGSQALLALPPWLGEHWPACSTLALSVDEQNTRGIRAYARAGFKDTGKREHGRIGWVRYMHKALHGRATSEA